jgi:hypothetical protein
MVRIAERDETDTDQGEAYWRRRVVTLVAGVGLLALVVWAFTGGSGKPPVAAASHSPAPGLRPAAYRSTSASPSPGARPTVSGLASPGASGLPRAPQASASGAAADRGATSGPSGSAQPTAGVAASVLTPGPGGRCAPGAVVLSVFSSKPSYAAGQNPQFSVYAVSVAAGTCTFDFAPSKLYVDVMSSGRVIWDSADCARGGQTRIVKLTRGVPVQESIIWNRAITLPGCVTLASSARPGTYQAQAWSASIASAVRNFKLTR